MPAVLRILSQEIGGEAFESRQIYLNSVSEASVLITPAEDVAPDESSENIEEAKVNIDGSNAAQFDNLRFRIRRNDGSEDEIDLKEKTYNFDIRDDSGEIVCMTDDPYELETGLLIVAMDSITKREKASEKLQKEQKLKKEAALAAQKEAEESQAEPESIKDDAGSATP